ncbi:MAG: beta-N-acetylhexosaminidase [Bacteroidota bacterium]
MVHAQDPADYPVVPRPAHLEARTGAFTLTKDASMSAVEAAVPAAEFLAGVLRPATGFALPISSEAASSVIRFVSNDTLDAEGYVLTAGPEGVEIGAGDAAGFFYGVQTLRQLMPAVIERGGAQKTTWTVPAVFIHDAPRFAYRGMHLDVARHFFPVSFVKRYIDLLALYKMNRFHWHLTEDQGWRIEIKQYPKLTEIGAYRDSTLAGWYWDEPRRYITERYGGFYTQEDIREVVAYAAERHVTVIPEIELPGHSRAALAAYPELACTPGPFTVATEWGVFEDIYCPKEETFTFLQNVLAEVMELFPSEYVHIGGDEAPKKRWKESPIAQEVMRREGLADENELQSYFVRRIETFLNENGRSLIGWDEIVEGGLSPTATVMYWRSWDAETARHVAEQGNDLIMTPNNTLYFDHYQAHPAGEPLAIGGLTTIEDVYAYEPVPAGFSDDEAKHVLGAQGNVWTEYMTSERKVEYMVFPRLLALSEVVWSPKTARSWSHFSRRLPEAKERLRVMEVGY